MSFNHFDASGKAVMVDVSGKEITLRTAVARARVHLKPETLREIREGKLAKGDVLAVARLAGISAAKKTPDLIPLAHPLAIHHVSVDFSEFLDQGHLDITATIKAAERTGVEMEAMVSATVTALTIYDMCKGADKSISIGEIVLLYKEGGKSGIFRRDEQE